MASARRAGPRRSRAGHVRATKALAAGSDLQLPLGVRTASPRPSGRGQTRTWSAIPPRRILSSSWKEPAADRPGDRAQEVHAEPHVVRRIHSSAEWIAGPRAPGSSSDREEPVGDRAERLRSQCESVKPRRTSAPAGRRARAPRRSAGPPTKRCAERRALPPWPPRHSSSSESSPATSASTVSASSSVWPGSSRQSTVTSQRPGMTFRFVEA